MVSICLIIHKENKKKKRGKQDEKEGSNTEPRCFDIVRLIHFRLREEGGNRKYCRAFYGNSKRKQYSNLYRRGKRKQ